MILRIIKEGEIINEIEKEYNILNQHIYIGSKAVIASVTGTETNPQGYSRQV